MTKSHRVHILFNMDNGNRNKFPRGADRYAIDT